jgi:hypothetical protein
VVNYNTYSKARASGNWDCIGEISGAPVPPWKAYLYVNIAIANTQPSSSSLSLSLSLWLHLYPCILAAKKKKKLLSQYSKEIPVVGVRDFQEK